MKLRLIALMFAVAVMLLPATAVAQPPVGIQVRGQWTIEVRNPDGSLVSRHEFDNHLEGPGFLTAFLRGASVPGRWTVGLGGGLRLTPLDQGGVCGSNFLGGPGVCLLREPGLTMMPGTPEVIEMSGTITADHDGNISEVASFVEVCFATVTPTECRATIGRPKAMITWTQFTPMAVKQSQIIQVKLVISFSSAPPS